MNRDELGDTNLITISPFGPYQERFAQAALIGAPAVGPFRFKVIREEWDRTTEPPTRVILEAEWVNFE